MREQYLHLRGQFLQDRWSELQHGSELLLQSLQRFGDL
jgi:hypothetical protein